MVCINEVSSPLPFYSIICHQFLASDAKERQDWINKLRSVAEFHASSIEQVRQLSC